MKTKLVLFILLCMLLICCKAKHQLSTSNTSQAERVVHHTDNTLSTTKKQVQEHITFIDSTYTQIEQTETFVQYDTLQRKQMEIHRKTLHRKQNGVKQVQKINSQDSIIAKDYAHKTSEENIYHQEGKDQKISFGAFTFWEVMPLSLLAIFISVLLFRKMYK